MFKPEPNDGMNHDGNESKRNTKSVWKIGKEYFKNIIQSLGIESLNSSSSSSFLIITLVTSGVIFTIIVSIFMSIKLTYQRSRDGDRGLKCNKKYDDKKEDGDSNDGMVLTDLGCNLTEQQICSTSCDNQGIQIFDSRWVWLNLVRLINWNIFFCYDKPSLNEGNREEKDMKKNKSVSGRKKKKDFCTDGNGTKKEIGPSHGGTNVLVHHESPSLSSSSRGEKNVSKSVSFHPSPSSFQSSKGKARKNTNEEPLSIGSSTRKSNHKFGGTVTSSPTSIMKQQQQKQSSMSKSSRTSWTEPDVVPITCEISGKKNHCFLFLTTFVGTLREGKYQKLV